MENLLSWKHSFEDFDKEEWASFLKSKMEIKEGEHTCRSCELNYNHVSEIGFIYKPHKVYKGYSDTYDLCEFCLYAICYKLIPNPSDYDYVGILKENVYELDFEYYLKSRDENANMYLTFYTNYHWNELLEENKEKLKEYLEEDDY